MAKKKIKIFQTNLFSKKIKKLSKKQKTDLDKAVKVIVADPKIGEEKKGDLLGVYVYKFKSSTELLLLAYEWDEELRTLSMIGVHENFYRDLKKIINKTITTNKLKITFEKCWTRYKIEQTLISFSLLY